MGDSLLFLGVLLFIALLLALLWRFRKRIVHNVTFTAETTMEQYEASGGRAAMQEVRYMEDEAIREVPGDDAKGADNEKQNGNSGIQETGGDSCNEHEAR